MSRHEPADEKNERQRWALLRRIEARLELPMVVLGFAWLLLLVLELTLGLTPALQTAVRVIWIIFILEFALRFVLAPGKLAYLKGNWLTGLALAVPALRIFRTLRVLQLFRATRGLHLLRLVAGLNRGMRALGNTLGRRGFGYVLVFTILVILVGAAGMFAFEPGLGSYGEAVWWTAMVMTTLGSDYWPQTTEGRILCFLLAVYALAVFGYITATLASFFIGQDVESARRGEGQETVRAFDREAAELRDELRALREQRSGGDERGEAA